MFGRLRNLYKKIYLRKLRQCGLSYGNDLQIEKGVTIDASFPWLIEIGNNVTLAPWVYILAHDGASKKQIGYSKIGKVKIGDNVYIGARSILLPGVKIGNNCVIGANALLTANTIIPDNSVVIGSPARVIMSTEEYKNKLINQRREGDMPVFEKEYTTSGRMTSDKKAEMSKRLDNTNGFVV